MTELRNIINRICDENELQYENVMTDLCVNNLISGNKRSKRLSEKSNIDYKVLGNTGEKIDFPRNIDIDLIGEISEIPLKRQCATSFVFKKEYAELKELKENIKTLEEDNEKLRQERDIIANEYEYMRKRSIIYENLYLDEIDNNSYNMMGYVKDFVIVLFIISLLCTTHSEMIVYGYIEFVYPFVMYFYTELLRGYSEIDTTTLFNRLNDTIYSTIYS